MNRSVLLSLFFLFIWQFSLSQISFVDMADVAGVGETGENHGVAFIDYDGDGWDDLYISPPTWP